MILVYDENVLKNNLFLEMMLILLRIEIYGYNFLNVNIKILSNIYIYIRNCKKNYELTTSEQSNVCVYKNVIHI